MIFNDPPVSWNHGAPQNAAEWEELADWVKTHPRERVCLGEYLVEDVPWLIGWITENVCGSWGFSVRYLEDDRKCLVVAHYENSSNQKQEEQKND